MAEILHKNIGHSADSLLELSFKLKENLGPKEISSLLTESISQFGYKQFVYALIPEKSDDLEEYINLSTLDQDWMDHYLSNRMYCSDFAAEHCTRETRPLLLSEMFKNVDAGLIRGKYAEVANAAREWGISNGVTIPLACLGRYHAGISLIADDSASQKDQDKLFEAEEKEILTLVNVIHASINFGSIARDFHGLTRREVEVLKWLSEGFKIRAIAEILKTSSHTVEKQARSARVRLKSATSAQAVAKAVLLGIID